MKTTIILILLALSFSAMGQTKKIQFISKHQFDNYGYNERHIIVRIAYGKSDACDTIFIGKQKIYTLICGDWHGWDKYDKKPKNASTDEGFALCNEVNPKTGRQLKFIQSDWYWFVYLDDMCGHKLYRLTHVNFKTNQYTAYLK